MIVKCDTCLKPLQWLEYNKSNFECSHVDCLHRPNTVNIDGLVPYCCDRLDTSIMGYQSTPSDTEE